MRYVHGFAVTVPFLDTNEDGSTSWNRALIHTNDNVDRRRIKRIIRKWARSHLGRTLYTHELLLIVKQVIRHDQPRFYVRQTTVMEPKGV